MDNIRSVAIARIDDRVTVAEYCATNAPHLPASLLADKLQKVLRSDRVSEHTRLTITDREVGNIHYDSDSGCLYLVVCAKEYQQRMAFNFLDEVHRRFEEKHGDDVSDAKPGGLSRVSRDLLSSLCSTFNNPVNNDKVSAVSLQVETVKGQRTDNTQSAVRNIEDAENLSHQSKVMASDADTFSHSAGALGTKMWWKNKTMIGMVVVSLIILITLILTPIVRGSNKSKAAK